VTKQSCPRLQEADSRCRRCLQPALHCEVHSFSNLCCLAFAGLKGLCHQMNNVSKGYKIILVLFVCLLLCFITFEQLTLWYWIENFLLASVKQLTNFKNPSSNHPLRLRSGDFDSENAYRNTRVVLKYHTLRTYTFKGSLTRDFWASSQHCLIGGVIGTGEKFIGGVSLTPMNSDNER
jgi:hypothetical protein